MWQCGGGRRVDDSVSRVAWGSLSFLEGGKGAADEVGPRDTKSVVYISLIPSDSDRIVASTRESDGVG